VADAQAVEDDIEEFDDEDEEDDEGRSSRGRRTRRRREAAGRSTSEGKQFRRSELRSIAMYQRGIMACILLYICTVVIAMALPGQMPLLRLAVVLVTGLISTVLVFLLSVQLFGAGLGVLFGFLTLIPCVGLITLLVINGQATGTLRRHGYHVGFLGADLSQFDR
jgi:hypothetical protein